MHAPTRVPSTGYTGMSIARNDNDERDNASPFKSELVKEDFRKR